MATTPPPPLGKCVFTHQLSMSPNETEALLPTACQITQHYIVVALANSSNIEVFDIPSMRNKQLSGSQGTTWALAVGGDVLASGGTNNSIEVWDLESGTYQKTLNGHTSTVRCLEILRDRKKIISASRDHTVRLWDMTTGKCISTSSEHSSTVRTITVSAAEDMLVSGSNDGTACVWRITDTGLECLQTLQGHEGAIFCVIFAGDMDSQIVTAGLDGSIRIWDCKDGKCLAIRRDHSAAVNHVIHTNSKLITSDASGSIYIWKVETGIEFLRKLKTPQSSIVSLASDGQNIISGDTDGAVTLWDVESGQLLAQFDDAVAIRAVGFLGDSRVAALYARDGEAIMSVWHVEWV